MPALLVAIGTFLVRFGLPMLRISVVLVPLVALVANVQKVADFLDVAHTRLTSLSGYAASNTWMSYYGMINTVIPLNEMLGMIGVLFVWFLACVAVRIAKSMIFGLS